MRAAYADPPYLGQGKRLYGHLHPDAAKWDSPESHVELAAMMDEKYDAWALSLSAPSLRTLLHRMPEGARVAAWVKPFAVFKPNVGVAYTWEPVIFKEGRKRGRSKPTCRDFVSANITLKKGLCGAKPQQFSLWLFDLLTLELNDEFSDLFPGTGGVSKAWEAWKSMQTRELI